MAIIAELTQESANREMENFSLKRSLDAQVAIISRCEEALKFFDLFERNIKNWTFEETFQMEITQVPNAKSICSDLAKRGK